MAEHPRTTAQMELREKLATCNNPESGCFRDNPNALLSMGYFDDGGIRANLNNIAVGADKAAREGIPLEEAEYFPTRIEGRGIVRIVNCDTPESIPHDRTNVAPNSIAEIEINVANCAYICGQSVELCPLVADR